jgi:hypothetical protein
MTADPNIELRRLRDLYADMSDGELEKLASEENSLTDEAQDALDDELDRRNLTGSIEDSRSHAGDATQPSFQELVTIREFRDLPAALLAQGLLQSADIECSLDDANIVRMDWFYSNAVGGVKLRVKPQDAQAAIEILNQPIPAGFNVDEVGIYEQPKCPECGSLDIIFEELNKPVAFTSAYLKVPLPIHRKGWKCHSCGHQWMDEPEAEPQQK